MLPRSSLRKSSLKSDRLKKLIGLLIITILIFSGLMALNNLFRVTRIEIEVSPNSQSIKGLDLYENKNIFFIQEEKMAEKIRAENPNLEKISVKKKLPNQLKINVKLYKPLAVLKASAGYLTLAEDGRILSKDKQNILNLPEINYYQKIDFYSSYPGEWIGFEDVITSLKLLKFSLDLKLTIDMIDINGLDMIAFNLSGSKILFTTKKKEEVQEFELEKIIRQFKIEGRTFKSLDLRFDKPVVVLNDL